MPDSIKLTTIVTKTCPRSIIKESELGGGTASGQNTYLNLDLNNKFGQVFVQSES